MSKSSPAPARQRPVKCRVCGTTEGPISLRALCRPCAIRRQTFAATELIRREGPTQVAWEVGMTRWAERIVAESRA